MTETNVPQAAGFGPPAVLLIYDIIKLSKSILEVEEMQYLRDEHRVHLIVYHLVWTPKRRKKVLVDATGNRCRELIKKDLNAKETGKLLRYFVFSIRRNLFNIREGDTMKEVKEFFEINESINKIFDDQVLEKMVMKKGDDFLGKVLKDKGDDFLGKVLKDKGDDFLRQLLLKEGPDYIVNFLFNIINENEEIKRKFQEKSKE